MTTLLGLSKNTCISCCSEAFDIIKQVEKCEISCLSQSCGNQLDSCQFDDMFNLIGCSSPLTISSTSRSLLDITQYNKTMVIVTSLLIVLCTIILTLLGFILYYMITEQDKPSSNRNSANTDDEENPVAQSEGKLSQKKRSLIMAFNESASNIASVLTSGFQRDEEFDIPGIDIDFNNSKELNRPPSGLLPSIKFDRPKFYTYGGDRRSEYTNTTPDPVSEDTEPESVGLFQRVFKRTFTGFKKSNLFSKQRTKTETDSIASHPSFL